MTEWVEATTLAEATDALRHHGAEAKLVGGGTALVLLMQQGLVRPGVLVGLRRLGDVPGWEAIEADGDALRIGGGVTLSAVAASPLVRQACPTVARAAGLVGNVRVRNAATLGGALAEADYAADLPAVLMNLGAEVNVADGRGSRQVAAADFFVDYFTTALANDEVVTGVRVPRSAPGQRTAYLKFSSRSREDRPCVVVAASASFDSSAVTALDVVVGAIGPVPQRWPVVTGGAIGGPLNAEAVRAVAVGCAAACDPLDDLRGSAWYRKQLVEVLVARTLGSFTGMEDRD